MLDFLVSLPADSPLPTSGLLFSSCCELLLKDVSSYGSYLRLLRETFYLGPDRLSKTHKRRERPKRGPSTRLPELTTSEEGKAVSSLETESYSYPSLTNSCFIFIILRGSHSDSPAILTCLPYLFPPGPTCLKPPMAFLCPEVLRLTRLVHEVSLAVSPIPPHSRTLGPRTHGWALLFPQTPHAQLQTALLGVDSL